MRLRLTLKVGVMRSFSTVQASDVTTRQSSCSCGSSDSLMCLMCAASDASSSALPSGVPAFLAASMFSIASASGWPRLAPVTQQASMALCMTSLSSMGAGATYLPLLVLNRSFTRPVILRLPSASSAPLSPVLSQPSSVIACLVSSGSL